MEHDPVTLAVLRREARDILDVVIESRCRLGEDPWEFLPELPTVDEHVVAVIRANRLGERGDDAATPEEPREPHPSSTAASEYRLLRQIALDYPELTRAVWSMIGRTGTTSSERSRR